MPFRVVEKTIANVSAHPEGLLGVVKVQMPEQCEEGGGRLRQDERNRNLRIVQSAIETFGTWAQRVEAPAVILLPEFSVGEETADWLRAEMSTARIAPNTLLALGLEEISTDRFRARLAESESRGDYAGLNFGENIDRVNTAMILTKDNAGNVSCYYQPKCTRSDYESLRQFRSETIYHLTFASHRMVISICSDFLLRDDRGTVMGSVMQDIEALYPQPADQRLDLILLIQKNPAPLHALYHATIRDLFYNRPHRIQTADTIICAVNSVNPATPYRFGKSNVSVMRRGRPPREYAKRTAQEHFAWCSLLDEGDHQNEDLHYVRWRLRSSGAISFVLNTDRRPWPPGNLESLPVRQIGLHRVTDNGQLEEVRPIPEVFELLEVLDGDFVGFVDATFQAAHLRLHFREILEYERLVGRIFAQRPGAILRQLLRLHGTGANCDHWDLAALAGVFRHFLLAIRLLAEGYADLRVEDERLRIGNRSVGVMDCRQRSFTDLREQLLDPSAVEPNLDILFFQRITNLYPWDGAPARLESLLAIISVSKPGPAPAAGSVARAPSPQVADIGTLISVLNRAGAAPAALRELLHENLRFS